MIAHILLYCDKYVLNIELDIFKVHRAHLLQIHVKQKPMKLNQNQTFHNINNENC